MAAQLYKRNGIAPGIAAVIAILLVSSLSPCFALCIAVQEAAKPTQKAAEPSCHEAPATPEAAAPDAPVCSENPSAARCCCVTERSATIPADAPMVAVTRDTAPTAPTHFEYVAFVKNSADNALHWLHVFADRSPPGTPAFIAHHALLI